MDETAKIIEELRAQISDLEIRLQQITDAFNARGEKIDPDNFRQDLKNEISALRDEIKQLTQPKKTPLEPENIVFFWPWAWGKNDK
jgi:DNA repair exonuclease SbcCD ATPase subunit